MRPLFLIILFIGVFTFCTKEKLTVNNDDFYEPEFTDDLVGFFEGDFVRRREEYDCDYDCNCSQVITIDTFNLILEVKKIDSVTVQIIDNDYSYANNTFVVDSTVSYYGFSPTVNSVIDVDEYIVKWRGDNYDSLLLNHNRGNGMYCEGGLYIYDSYKLKRVE